MTDWRDGGDKPLKYDVYCGICGALVECGTRDYFYRKNEESGRWEQAHAKCVPKHTEAAVSDVSGSEAVVEVLNEIENALGATYVLQKSMAANLNELAVAAGRMADELERLANQGAK